MAQYKQLFLGEDYIVKLINANRQELFPIIIGALYKNSKQHWNSAVHGLTFNVLKLLMEARGSGNIHRYCNSQFPGKPVAFSFPPATGFAHRATKPFARKHTEIPVPTRNSPETACNSAQTDAPTSTQRHQILRLPAKIDVTHLTRTPAPATRKRTRPLSFPFLALPLPCFSCRAPSERLALEFN